jgi:hypothetical protein
VTDAEATAAALGCLATLGVATQLLRVRRELNQAEARELEELRREVSGLRTIAAHARTEFDQARAECDRLREELELARDDSPI